MANNPHPTQITLNKEKDVLTIAWDNDESYDYSAEYLRAHSPSAEVQGHGPGEEVLQLGKEDVLIEHVEAVGNYAIGLHFDDGHNTGIYAWDTLYGLGKNHEQIWGRYLERLIEAGYERKKNRLNIQMPNYD